MKHKETELGYWGDIEEKTKPELTFEIGYIIEPKDLQEGKYYKFIQESVFYIASFDVLNMYNEILVKSFVCSSRLSVDTRSTLGHHSCFKIVEATPIEVLYYNDNIQHFKNAIVDIDGSKFYSFNSISSYKGIYIIQNNIAYKLATYQNLQLKLEEWVRPILETLKDNYPLHIEGDIPFVLKTIKDLKYNIKKKLKYAQPSITKSGIKIFRNEKDYGKYCVQRGQEKVKSLKYN